MLRLKIHCCPEGSQRKAVSGVVDVTASSKAGAPAVVFISVKLVTTPGVPTELQLASNTMNLHGTVLPCLKELEPSGLTGCRI